MVGGYVKWGKSKKRFDLHLRLDHLNSVLPPSPLSPGKLSPPTIFVYTIFSACLFVFHAPHPTLQPVNPSPQSISYSPHRFFHEVCFGVDLDSDEASECECPHSLSHSRTSPTRREQNLTDRTAQRSAWLCVRACVRVCACRGGGGAQGGGTAWVRGAIHSAPLGRAGGLAPGSMGLSPHLS